MKQKNYDAKEMYKEYMQSVNADPTAIDDILSGERQPANMGARIKHSTGKMATITAAAAVIAVCAGIGLTNLNMNDDSSVKPATTTKSESAITPAAQQQDNFKTEVTGMYASDHGLRVFVKCTALTDEAKKLVKEADEALKNNKLCQLSVTTVNNNTDKFAGASVKTLEISGDSFTTELTYQPNGSTYIFKDGTKLSIRVVTPAEYADEKLVPSDRTVEFTVKKNMTERVFKSASGKTLWLSDFQFNCNADYRKLEENAMSNFEMTFTDGTVKTQKELLCCGGSGTPGENGDPNAMIAFFDKIDSSKVTSIKYAGETFTPQQAEPQFKTELVELNASDHGMIAAVKLTALNAEAKTAMKTKGFCVDCCSENEILFESLSIPRVMNESENVLIAYVDFVWSKKDYTLNNGDVISVMFRLPSTNATAPKNESESRDSALKSADRHIEITINKNKTERVFKSKDGKTIWLSDYHYRAENVSEGLLKSEKWKTNSVKFADGTVMTGTQLGMLGAATTTPDSNKNAVATFYFENHIDSSKVVSITYEGVEYTAQ